MANYILDVSRAIKACLLLTNGQSVSAEDIPLLTEADVQAIIAQYTSGEDVTLTNNNAVFSWNQTTQSGNIPQSSQLSFNSTTKVFTWTRGNGESAASFNVMLNGGEVKIATSITVGGTTYAIGTPVDTVLTALASSVGTNNITSSQTINGRFDVGSPLLGVSFPSSPITNDVYIVTYLNGIATFTKGSGSWALTSFLSRAETVRGEVVVASNGTTLRMVIPIPSSINGTIPTHATITVKSVIGEGWDFLDYTTTEIGVNYYIAPAVGNITYNYAITK